MKSATRNIPKSKWLLSMLLLAVLTILPSDALSQEQTQPIQVTHVVTDEFPTVKVRVAAWGTNMVIIPNENLNVFEDGVPFVVDSVAPVDVGVRVAFVIDPGDGVRNTGINLRTVYEIAAEYLETFTVGRPWMMANVDEITVIVQEGDSTEIISPLRSAVRVNAPDSDGLPIFVGGT